MEQENIKCEKCTSNNILTFFRQINFNDEIPNKYCRCLDCQYGWKQSFGSPGV